MRQRNALVLHHEREQLELCRRKMDRLPCPPQQVALDIDLQISRCDHGWANRITRLRAAQQCLETRQQLSQAERLCDVVVSPGFQGFYFVVLRIAYRNHHNSGLRRQFPDSSASLHTTDARHVDIEQHQIMSLLPDGAHGLLPASRFLYIEPAGGQRFSECASESKLIIDD